MSERYPHPATPEVAPATRYVAHVAQRRGLQSIAQVIDGLSIPFPANLPEFPNYDDIERPASRVVHLNPNRNT